MDVWPQPECQRVSNSPGCGLRAQPRRMMRAVHRRALLSTTTRWWLRLPLAAGAIAVPQQARAANTPCLVVGSTATCTTDQGLGVAFHDGSGITTVNVQTLITPIQPPLGSGASCSTSSAPTRRP
jgi:hypothetical protein